MKVRVLPTPVRTAVVVVKWRVSSTVFVPDLSSREKLVLRVRIFLNKFLDKLSYSNLDHN